MGYVAQFTAIKNIQIIKDPSTFIKPVFFANAKCMSHW